MHMRGLLPTPDPLQAHVPSGDTTQNDEDILYRRER
jgi:hypothetical protein